MPGHKNFFLSLFLLGTISSALANGLSYSGRLINSNGSPVNGPVKLKFEMAYGPSFTPILCTQEIASVPLNNGVFHLELNPTCTPPSSLQSVLAGSTSSAPLAIRVTDITDTDPLKHKSYSFQTIHSMPFAKVSDYAKNIAVTGNANGDVLTWDNGAWIAAPGGAPNTGMGPNQIVQLDGAGKLPAVDGSQLTNVSASSFTGVLPIVQGGTGGTNPVAARANLFSDVFACSSTDKIQINLGGSFTCVPDLVTDNTKLPLAG